jgi:hypothetical protein
MKQIIIAVALILISFAAGLGVGKYLSPEKIKKETITVEKEVIKRDVVTIIKEIKKPDGTIETTSTVVDKSEISTELKRSELIIVVKEKHNWLARAIIEARELDLRPQYGAGIERRILGPFFVGAYYTTQKTFGATISFEF